MRARVARVAAGVRSKSTPRVSRTTLSPESAPQYIEEWLSGEEVETAFGRHFETEKLYERTAVTAAPISARSSDLPADLLDTLSGGAIPAAAPAGVGVSRHRDHRARRRHGHAARFWWASAASRAKASACASSSCAITREEASLLDALARHLEPFRVMITYNGRAFDQPLLETRYRLNRARPPFARYGASGPAVRRAALVETALRKLPAGGSRKPGSGRGAQGDIPGALIPYVYFEYLRTRQAARLLPVFHHNAIDILTLACLTGIVPYAFKDPANMPMRHGAEMAGMARWLRQAGELEQARTLFRRSIDAGLRDELLFRTLWDLAALERKLGADSAALSMWGDLAAARNPFRVRALEELAKHHEHRAKDRARALAFTREARAIEDSVDLQRREARLARARRPLKRGRS